MPACVLVCVLAGGRVGAEPGTPSALWALAGGVESALVVGSADALDAHVGPALSLLAFSFPQAAPGHAGTLRGAQGGLALHRSAARVRAGLGGSMALAVLWPSHAASPVLAVAGLDEQGCAALARAVSGGTPPDGVAWARRGVCVVAVGECAVHRCGAVGLPAPATAADAGLEALGRVWPAVMVVRGDRVVSALPAQARGGLSGLRQLALGWRAEAGGFAGEVLLRRATRWGSVEHLLPLDPAEAAPGPLPAAARVVARWDGTPPPPLPSRTQTLLGSVLGPALPAGLGRMEWQWLGVDARAGDARDAAQLPWVFPSQVSFRSSAAGPAHAAVRARLQQQGFTEDADGEHWLVGSRGARVMRSGDTLTLQTGTAPAPPAFVTVPVETPRAPLVMAHWHGARVGALARASPLSGVTGAQELAALLALDTLLGPTLERTGPSSAALWLDSAAPLTLHVSVRVLAPGR
jgi:hypothetical protein